MVCMGRVATGVIANILFVHSLAAADEPIPKPAPPETNWYANTRPADSAVAPQGQWRPVRINRTGVFALAGLARVGGRLFGRLDLGIPIPSRTLPRLRIALTIESRYGTEGSASTSELGVAPELRYDWRLPFKLKSGDVVLVAGVGLERMQHFMKFPDEPFWPAKWESYAVYSYRFGGALQYRSSTGLLVSLQPVTVVVPYSKPESPDPRWMVMTPTTGYEVSLTAGYQLP
jgi:hypothetical protein